MHRDCIVGRVPYGLCAGGYAVTYDDAGLYDADAKREERTGNQRNTFSGEGYPA